MENTDEMENTDDPGIGVNNNQPDTINPAGPEGVLPPGDAIHDDLTELSRLLVTHPGISGSILDVFYQHLTPVPSRESYERLMQGLGVLIGPGATRIVLESVKIQSNEFFDRLSRSAQDADAQQAVVFLRQIAALYGHLVKDAFFLSFKHTNEDWRTADISCYRKGDGEAWFIELELLKYNGERVFLRMSPISAFQLADLFIQELSKLPSDSSGEGIAKRFHELPRHFRKESPDPSGIQESPPDGYA